MRKNLKASATVETAMIMSVVLLTIFFLMSVAFYEHDKAVLNEQLFLMARNKCMYGKEEMTEHRISNMCMATNDLDIRTEDGAIYTKVMSDSSVHMFFVGEYLRQLNEGRYIKCYAPETLRIMKLGQSIKDSIINERGKKQ